MDVLILGGNRFFGKQLAELLLAAGHNITLLNRGNSDDGLGAAVNRIKCDRTESQALNKLVKNKKWDLIYDQVCFDAEEATQALEIFDGKTKRYIFTSSQSVYDPGKDISEQAFEPNSFVYSEILRTADDYAGAKRQAESVFSKHAPFPVTLVRIPIVLGLDDYTCRLKFHVQRVNDDREIYFPNLDAKISFISSADAARALMWLSANEVQGPINFASPKPIPLMELIGALESSVGRKINLAAQGDDENRSPYGISEDWYMSVAKAQNLGFVASEITVWLQPLLTKILLDRTI